jgi:rRNA-processing protein FCF1
MRARTVETVAERLTAEAERLAADIGHLVDQHSSIRRWNNNSDSPIVFVMGDYAWNKLDLEGQRLQSALLERHARFFDIVRTLLYRQSNDVQRQVEQCQKDVVEVIEQSGCLYEAKKERHRDDARAALGKVGTLLEGLHCATEVPSFIPDTNALLFNPRLDTWLFDGVPSFELVLVPSVAAELDKLKIHHGNPQVRDKAERVIRQHKECRRRARDAGLSLRDGVPIVSGVSTLSAVAVEPNFDASLPWLDRSNDDDRFLAAAIEVMRDRPRSAVVLVTRDINLQNKADHAGVPFVEPPVPPPTPPQAQGGSDV